MKKLCYFALFLVLAVMLMSACGTSETTVAKRKSKAETEMETASLYARGMEIIDKIVENASTDAWRKIYVSTDDLNSYGEKIAEGNYEEPSSVYELRMVDEDALFEKSGMDAEMLSEDMRREAATAFFTALPTTYMARLGGTNVLAAASIYTASTLFVDESLKESLIYIYEFVDGYPISVSFTKGEDGAVLAKGSVVFLTEYMEELEKHNDDVFEMRKIK